MGVSRSFFSLYLKMSSAELGCTYAAMILHDDGVAVTADKLKSLMDAAGVEYESYWPSIFEKSLGEQDLDKLLTTPAVGGGAAAGPAAGGAAEGGAAAAVEEERKKSSSEDEDIEAPMGMFGDDY